ncbi:hypothetical protein ABC382_00080 [Lysinibacillus sp. 1P01SD]
MKIFDDLIESLELDIYPHRIAIISLFMAWVIGTIAIVLGYLTNA